MTATRTQLPGYVVGSWSIDPVHSDLSFSIRHMMVSKVRGRFATVDGTIVTAEDPLASSATATVDVDSFDTGNEQRDNHVRSADFLEAEKFPTMTFRSTGVRQNGDGFQLEGELSLHGVTRPLTLDVEVNGFTKDPFGGTRAGFSATGEINRKDFGVTIDMPMDGGGVVVGDKVSLHLEIEAVLDSPES
ncbi:MAG TPA: YceI family protein [Mycobacteriales bacterium]|nr:YceI family protein [Mycobacteriales bacterium]